ncbi:regulator of microtubule dynamics protein 3 isoform X1 [Trichomycterus rosablanca]|uniref:regulator of microtubule dynamics protein 3 isoform X1 n=1 Tax=Trichomycterus rosablanca TaxID=2290929 RepID=UPI002F3560FF
MSSLGRNGLIGMGVGVTVSTGLIAFLIIKEVIRRRNRTLLVETSAGGFGLGAVVDGPINRAQDGREAAALATALSGLTAEQHAELRNTLDEVMLSVSTLRSEVAELRSGLREIASTIIEDVRKGVEESQRTRRRRHFLARERTDSMSSSSIYFNASNGASSEGGYTTAYSTAESDYTDRETDRDDECENDDDDDDEEEERSCSTVLTLRPDEGQSEEDYVDGDDEKLMMSPELALLLTQSDLLHAGDSGKKTEGFNLLIENKPLYGDNIEFLWRLARAYNDMCENAEDEEERRNYAEQGRDEAEAALQRNGLNADCHKWFAVLTGQSSQCDSMHSKLKSSHILKISRLSWMEQKAAAALYEVSPSSSVHLALENFLKVIHAHAHKALST